jgi:hypothetical protein
MVADWSESSDATMEVPDAAVEAEDSGDATPRWVDQTEVRKAVLLLFSPRFLPRCGGKAGRRVGLPARLSPVERRKSDACAYGSLQTPVDVAVRDKAERQQERPGVESLEALK